MRMVDLIVKKKKGEALTADEIAWMVNGFTNGEIPDYQMSSMMMAICFQGMNEAETLALTLNMTKSGDELDLSDIKGIKVDKHSTGGVGDKTSIALAPLVSSVGVKVAKMSGRGLGHTGGTIDKLESFEGFSTSISTEHFMKQVNELGMAIMGQTKDLAPADKKLYALRDVTGTVENMSLIASSIMSKKLAAGADAIVLDTKCGSGAFMKTEEDAIALATEMVKIGKNAGRKMSALITDMDEPLGYAVGNALEVKEAIATLKGEGPKDFTEICLALGSEMVCLSGICDDITTARKLLEESIANGSALKQLAAFVHAQGGNDSFVYHPELLPSSKYTEEVCVSENGYIEKIICDEVGNCSLILGGGRETKESEIDLSVGIVLKKKVGDSVSAGESIATIHYNDKQKMEAAKERFLKAVTIGPNKIVKNNIVIHRIGD